MAYCPKCDLNVQLIVTHDSYSDSLPRCSNCYAKIQYPHIQSKSEYREHTDALDQKYYRYKIDSIEKELPQLKLALNNKPSSTFNWIGFLIGIVFAGLSLLFYHKYDILPNIVTNYLYIFFDFVFMCLFGIGSLALFLTCYSTTNRDEDLRKAKEIQEKIVTQTKELEELKKKLK